MADNLIATRDGAAEVFQLFGAVKRDNERLQGELDTARRSKEAAERHAASMRRDRDDANKLLADRETELLGKSWPALASPSVLSLGS
jgi:hypothetical protein